eukprot:SAG31_NODE_26887_length_434_cov_5.614925_1_plen_61_part_10
MKSSFCLADRRAFGDIISSLLPLRCGRGGAAGFQGRAPSRALGGGGGGGGGCCFVFFVRCG